MRRDDGSAMIEFTWLALLLLVPLVYLVLAVFEVQRTAYAVTNAAREAGRAFVTAPSVPEAYARADAAVELAMTDQGAALDTVRSNITCGSDPCLTPGGRVTVVVRAEVPLPFVPDLFGRSIASVSVDARHEAIVDRYAQGRT
jgi:Flp pilus assembly protein TadG